MVKAYDDDILLDKLYGVRGNTHKTSKVHQRPKLMMNITTRIETEST